MKRSLTREERIGKPSEFKKIFASGKKYSCRGAKIFFIPNGRDFCRIGVTLQRKFGNAVQRNYTRRIMKEIFRSNKDALKAGFDIILIIYPGNFTFADREEQFKFLIGRSGLAEVD